MRRWLDAARARLALLLPGRAEARMDDELAFHIDMEAERIAREERVTAPEARRRARAAFGGITQHKETLRAGRGLAWFGTLSLDARLAARMLRKSPGLSAVAVVGMAVAIAIGCVCFSAVQRIVDASLPVDQGDRVIGIHNIDIRNADDARATHMHFLPAWRDAMKSVEEFGAYRNVSRTVVTAEGWTESARVAEMTASGFRITRVAPVVGRYFVDADERLGASPVAVIGYRAWQQRWGGRPDIVGQAIQVGDTRHVVVGVMPEGYAFPVNNRIWVPLRLDPLRYERFHAPSLDVFARLAPGATLEDARREAALAGQRLALTDSAAVGDLRQRVIPYTHMFIDNAEAAWMYHLIQLVVTALLVVIGTNVAVLVYARTASRLGEIAIRTSLGASRSRIVGQLFAEALALSLIAAGLGVVVAWLALRQIAIVMQGILGEAIPYWLHFELTPEVVMYAIGLAVLAALIIGIVPALKITGKHFRATLAELSGGGSGLRLGRPWTIMIVAQVAIAVALLPLSIGGLHAWSKGHAAKSIIAAQEILTASLSFDSPEQARVDSAEAARRYVALRTELIGRLRADARVAQVVLTSSALGDEDDRRFEAEQGGLVAAEQSQIGALDASVDSAYFRMMGIPLLAGRSFEPADLSAPNVVVVNRSFMRKMFGHRLAVGSRIRVSAKPGAAGGTAPASPWLTIVGVVSDYPVDSSVAAPRIYRPLAADAAGPIVVAVKASGARATDLMPVLRGHALATSPLLRVDGIRTMSQAFSDSFAELRLAVIVVELITLSVILLSAAGIYALMAFTITRRRREIGIRAALGEAPGRILAGELWRVLRQVGVGVVVGLAAGALTLSAMFEGSSGPARTGILLTVAAIMIAVGTLAALRPALVALRIPPTEALRAD